jgi:hypothetical protein
MRPRPPAGVGRGGDGRSGFQGGGVALGLALLGPKSSSIGLGLLGGVG